MSVLMYVYIHMYQLYEHLLNTTNSKKTINRQPKVRQKDKSR